MIGYLKGKVIDRDLDRLILEVNGVGYEVSVPNGTQVPEEAALYIYTHVREDQLALFGFADKGSLDFYKHLLSVSGIGPKVALAIVGSAPIENLRASIANGDPSLLSSVSGVGKKTAEKAVIELKGKLGFASAGPSIMESGTEDVLSALTGLGFQRPEVVDGLAKLPAEITDNDDKIKWLIKNLGRK